MFNFNFFLTQKNLSYRVVMQNSSWVLRTSIKKVQTSSSLTSALIKLIWGTLILVGEQRGLVIFMTRLMSWKRSCFSQRWKKKNFGNKNSSLHEKKNEFAFLRTFTKHRRTNGVVYYRHNLAKCLGLKKKSTIIGCRNYATWY